MSESQFHHERQEFAEERESLAQITLGPLVWGAHFLVSYAATAVYCARFAETPESVLTFRLGFVLLTVMALAVIGWIAARSWRKWDVISGRDDDGDLAQDRHEFLGRAAFLLAAMSFIGVIYVALPFLFIGSCQ